jgi:hypothetical protein
VYRIEHTRALFAFTEADRWRPGIGDPTFMGWFTVICYFATAVLAARVLWTRRLSAPENRFWFATFLVLLGLGINKQLDLQTWFTLTAKYMAQSEGWYEHRRPIQVGFIFLVVCAGFLTLLFFWKLAGGCWRQQRLAFSGLVFLCGFVVIRAASFHHVDLFLKHDIGGMRMNWVFEIGGILLIAAGALSALRSTQPPDNLRGSIPKTRLEKSSI